MGQTPFAIRRAALGASLPPQTVVVLASASVKHRNADTQYMYRQESNFYYLTGHAEPESIFVCHNLDGALVSMMFCPAKDDRRVLWEGPFLNASDAKQALGMDESHPLEAFESKLAYWLTLAKELWLPLDGAEKTRSILSQVQTLWNTHYRAYPTGIIKDLRLVLDKQRLIKDKSEILSLRQACAISVDAHRRVMKKTKPDHNEWELEAILMYHFIKNGARAPAYPSIVASGTNACTLHYVKNSKLMREGELVLIDAGAEFDFYASDITRTIPVSPRFTAPQREIYNLVLEAQNQAIGLIKPGLPWTALQDRIVDVLLDGLIDLNLLKGRKSTLKEEKALNRFYPHSSGHWLGLDVHDAGPYKQGSAPIPLAENMVFTVEPGLYIPEDEDIPAAYRGIGVRIEDDLLVTKSGYDILTGALPKTIEEIESLREEHD